MEGESASAYRCHVQAVDARLRQSRVHQLAAVLLCLWRRGTDGSERSGSACHGAGARDHSDRRPGALLPQHRRRGTRRRVRHAGAFLGGDLARRGRDAAPRHSHPPGRARQGWHRTAYHQRPRARSLAAVLRRTRHGRRGREQATTARTHWHAVLALLQLRNVLHRPRAAGARARPRSFEHQRPPGVLPRVPASPPPRAQSLGRHAARQALYAAGRVASLARPCQGRTGERRDRQSHTRA